MLQEGGGGIVLLTITNKTIFDYLKSIPRSIFGKSVSHETSLHQTTLFS